MHTYYKKSQKWIPALLTVLLLFCSTTAMAAIQGVEATTFNLRAKPGYISTADGSSVFFWGYANGNGIEQYPGPTMIVTEGQTITVNLTNNLKEPTSIVFPGLEVAASGGVPGLLTREALPDRVTTVTYTITNLTPGTYTYYSGTHSDLQVEMGLVGALIVRPSGYDFR